MSDPPAGLPADEITLPNAISRIERLEGNVGDLRNDLNAFQTNRFDAINASLTDTNGRIDTLQTRVGTVERIANRANNWIRDFGAPFVRNFDRRNAAYVDPTQPAAPVAQTVPP